MGTNITGIGNANAIGFKSRVTGGIYFPPELKDALVGVWSAYGKSNDSTDRNIIKNKIKDRGGDFVISNAAFKLNSGFGKYEITFQYFPYIENITNVSDSKVVFGIGGQLLIPYSAMTENIPSFKIKVNGLSGTYHFRYYYRSSDGVQHSVNMAQDGYYELPICYNVQSSSDGTNCGFANNGNDVVTITQIPSFEGAFVTDGIDDLITSTKTVQEMLGGSNEITVVSMMANLDSRQILCNSNFSNTNGYNVRNTLEPNGVISMLGYTDKNGTTNNLNLIMGDKDSIKLTDKVNFNSDYVFYPAQYYKSYYQVAWYWTIIANKVLTTDQINQVIAYFNLDRTLKPDILCNITKQGITNDNHADFNDKLIDYSGNGRDIQMNNLAWKGGSGIAAKQYETFKDWLSESSSTSIIKQIDEFTRIVESTTNGYWVSRIRRDSDLDKVYDPINVYLYQDNNFLIHECKYEVDGVKYSIPIYESVGKGYHKLGIYTKDRYTELPENAEKVVLSEWYFPKSNKGSIKYSLIPSYKGGILLDGINDFGKVTRMPIYKDYTIVVDYERISGREEALISKAYLVNQGAFVLMETSGTAKHSYSFGAYTAFNRDDFTRTLLYQSKYKCGDVNLIVGEGIDGDTLWLGTLRDNDYRFFNGAIYSLMSFPYSMSEFLIERQLKKHKLGTLYPDMVEFRPVIKSNASYDSIVFYYKNEKVENGTYLTVGSSIGMHIRLSSSPVNEIKSITVNGIPATFKYHDANNNIYQYDFNLTSKSPQKINITIDEYIRFEDIVQPYPVLLRFKDENGNEVSWGGKFKVGSTITRIGSIADPESNLLNGLYSISGLSLNGKGVTSSTSIVEKQMVFKTIATYLLDNNEPKCILSPRLLRIPNSSYKILGYIPDISGHGNHGKINNSAYAGASGANGYPYDYNNSSFWCDSVLAKVVSGELIEYFAVKNSTGFSNITSGVYKGEIKVTGVTKAISENKISRLRIYTNSTTDNELIDITQDGNYNIDIKGVGDANRVFFYAIPNNPNESIVVRLTEPIYIEQVGEYEGAYCLDGVDDFVTIPTLSSGGKQVLMKVNWNTINSIIYDQRGSGGFAIYCSDYNNPSDSITVPAYKGRNAAGTTYIDGIRNEYIIASQLRNVTHNIVEILDTSYAAGKTNPIIGKSHMNSNYGNLALYDFMLFDNISTDDKIKELNEYVGIEAKVELPPYYSSCL